MIEAVRASFSRASKQYAEIAEVQSSVAELLCARIPKKPYARILEIGCGTGFLTQQIRTQFPTAVIDAIDFSPEMIARAKLAFEDRALNWIVADALQFSPTENYDLIVSSSSLHWIRPFPELGRKLARMLKPGGEICASCMLDGTLSELHDLRSELFPAKVAPNRLPRADEITDAFLSSDLSLADEHYESFRVWYPSSETLFRSLRDTGVASGPYGVAAKPLLRGELKRLANLYAERYGAEGRGVYSTYKVGYFIFRPSRLKTIPA